MQSYSTKRNIVQTEQKSHFRNKVYLTTTENFLDTVRDSNGFLGYVVKDKQKRSCWPSTEYIDLILSV